MDIDKFVFYSDKMENDTWPGQFSKFVQEGADLGERMLNAFRLLFRKGYEKLVVIGSDCLELNSTIIEKGLSELDNVDAVIGPAWDGGYYLLGVKKDSPFLFRGIDWSTAKVLEQTLNILKQQEMTYSLLEPLNDIDKAEDWLTAKQRSDENRKIIFVYNAKNNLFSLLTDYVHKVVDPSTYQCNLCRLTHSNFGMKQEWKAFIDSVHGNKSFLYKDDFLKQYQMQSVLTPAVFLQEKGTVRELFTAAEINQYRTLTDLQHALSEKLGKV